MTMIFDMIVFLVIGVAAGAIASFYMGRQQELLPNLVIGIVGAFIGGFIAKLLGLTAYNVIGEVVVATAGAILGLFIWQRPRHLNRSLRRRAHRLYNARALEHCVGRMLLLRVKAEIDLDLGGSNGT